VADGCKEAVLERNQTCAFSVRFAPGSAGAKTGQLRVTATLTGTGSAPAAAMTTAAADEPAPRTAAPGTPTVIEGPAGAPGRDGRDGRDARDG
jgi:hypothetical protein